jgi:Domain found in IF2B/IF5
MKLFFAAVEQDIKPFNFECRMHRQPEHVMHFLLAEMGTSGSLDGQQRLVVKGRFAPKNFEGILRRYISKFKFTEYRLSLNIIFDAVNFLMLIEEYNRPSTLQYYKE